MLSRPFWCVGLGEKRHVGDGARGSLSWFVVVVVRILEIP